MQHKREHHPHARRIIALGLLLVVFIMLGALMMVNPAPPQQSVEKELDAQAFLGTGK